MTASRDIKAIRAALTAFDHAEAECARLRQPDDHGSGERTARLATLAAWEAARERALDDLEASWGKRDPAEARAALPR
jgi:formylglycine-generating enzyme required for sulfatase activity